MAGTARKLGKTAVALAASALLEKAVQKAADDPRVRRKAKALGKAAKRQLRAAGKKVSRAAKRAGKRAPKLRLATKKRVKKLIRR